MLVRFIWLLLLAAMSWSCRSGADHPHGGTAVIALPADADVLNPILWSGSSTGTVLQFLFADMVEESFDSSRGALVYSPNVVRSWEWSASGKDLTIHLRSDVYWSDGVAITSHDVRFSYAWYANPKSGSLRRNALVHFPRKPDGTVDMDRAITITNDTTLTFHFVTAYDRPLQLSHATLNIVPRHAFVGIPDDSLRTSSYNTQPISGGHYVVKSWIRKQEIVLESDPRWILPHAAYLKRVIFRILPDMSTRVVELKTGAVDLVEGLSPDEAREFMTEGSGVRIERQSFRRYDFIGWSNIDREAYEKHRIVRPHPIFGDRRVRQALTMAIDRDELIDGWLKEFGQRCEGPVSPAFRWAYNDTMTVLPYDPSRSKEMLAQCGWTDRDGDGVLDRDGRPFEFTLVTNAGNPRRAFALQKIQADLRAIGIVCEAQFLETNHFSAGLRRKEFDAFIAGLSTNLYVDLIGQYGSDLEKYPGNYCSYQNALVDSLLLQSGDSAVSGLKQVQSILQHDQPMTFLFWFDNIVGIRDRLKGTQVGILSPYHRFYEWYVIP